MRVQSNIEALNAYRNLNNTNRAMGKSLERLSSGFRINRAADDAAGLSISEKMRGQIRGLNQAARNAQDGISLIQTAEGSLNETHAILQRMRELAVQAANDTLTASDRNEIQKEVDQLRTEIDRIANTTEFNTKKLLDGTTSALASTDNNNTKVFMRDGLRVEDQFGQKTSGGGNFRLDIQATPGTAQIQKTDIFKIKHEGDIVEWTDVEGTHSSPAALQAAMKEYAELEGIDINLIEGEEGAVLSGDAVYDPDDGRVTLNVTIAEDTTVDEVVALVDDLTVRGGLGAVNEVQNVSLENVVDGQFRMSYEGDSTIAINYNVTAGQLQNRLESIDALEGNIEVTGEAGNWNVEFINDLAATEVSLLEIDDGELEGPEPAASVSTIQTGSGGQDAKIEVNVGAATAGSGFFTLSVEGYGETGNIAHDAVTTAVVNALNEIGVTASDEANDGSMAFVEHAAGEYKITLQGSLSNQAIELNADLSGLRFDADQEMTHAGTTASSDSIVLDFAESESGNTFTITFNNNHISTGVTTASIAYNASAFQIRQEIYDTISAATAGVGVAAYQGLDIEDIVVVRDGVEVTIDFEGVLARHNIISSTNTSGTIGIDASTTGVDFDDQTAAVTLEANSSVTGGNFTISIDGFGESGPINFSSNEANLQTNVRNALAGMTATSGPAEGYTIRATDVTVTKIGDNYDIEFTEGLTNLELNPHLDLSNLEYTIEGAEASQTQAGQGGFNLTKSIYLSGAGDGTFELEVTSEEGGTNTVDLAWDATADQVQEAIINAHEDGIEFVNNIDVTGAGTRDNPWVIEFINDLGGSDAGSVALAVTNTANLEPLQPGGEVTVSQEMVEGARMSEILAFNVIDGDHVIGFNPNTYTTELNEVGFREGLGEIAQLDTALYDIDRFWDASGNFLIDEPQTITLVQGDGTKAAFTLFRDDTIGDVVERLDAAIRNEKTNFTPGTIEAGKGLGQGVFDPNGNAEFAYYVEKGQATEGGTFDTVEGTIVVNSAIAGSFGEIEFVGDEEVIKALSLTTIQDAEENRFTVDVIDAHTDEAVAEDVTITSNVLVGVVHSNVDVEFDPNANIAVGWQTEEVDAEGNPIPKGDYDNAPNAFYFEAEDEAYETYVHLADNTMVFHIGANPLQDVGAAIGDMRARALGVHNTLVMDRDSANDSIAKIDRAIERVSAERSKLGALQNRLEHTISNLAVASENLTAAESRIRDVDMAAEMMEFTKNQILAQAGTAMLAQANMKPQMVLQLLG